MSTTRTLQNGNGHEKNAHPPPLTWPEVYARLRDAPPGKLYGITPGGAIVAGLTGRAVDRLEDADWAVTDVLDGRHPREFHVSLAGGRPLWGLHARRPGEGRVRFPWEAPRAQKEAENAVARLLEHVGEDPSREGLLDTPKRVAKALLELTEGYEQDPAAILGRVFSEAAEEMVLVRDVPFWSLCEHHMLPFRGTATIAYVPSDGRIVGLSKISRLVQCYARRLQVQERLTREIAQALEDHLAPAGVAVLVQGEHTCMSMRGIRTPATMVTSHFLGSLREPGARKEFLALARDPGATP